MKIAFIFFLAQFALCKPIKVTHIQDLNFESLVQGDGKKKIKRGRRVQNNARFKVTGNKNTNYSIILPDRFTISRDGLGGFPLTVKSLRSRPEPGANGDLGKKGRQTIYIGATLQAIPNNQPIGSYSGSFLIEVLY